MSDESIINLSDSTKATMRNYAMVAGFMVLFINAVVYEWLYFSADPSSLFNGNNYVIFKTVIAFSLIVFGSVLASLHKRDLIAITFLMIGLYSSFAVMSPLFGLQNPTINTYTPHLIVSVILGIAMLFTRNEQKYICAAILVLGSIPRIIGLNPSLTNAGSIGFAIIALVSVYAVLCIGLENPKFPGYRLLTADEEDETKDGSPVHFKISGSILGYSLMMIPAIMYIISHLNIISITYAQSQSLGACCGLMLIFVGFLMLTAGRMKFTPFMFMMVGTVMLVEQVFMVWWMLALFLLIIAALCLFRSDRKILVGISILINGIIVAIMGTAPHGVILALMFIQIIILIYVCFALCSDNRLKLI